MCHLQSCPLEAALDIESLIRFAAIQNAFVAAYLSSYIIKGLDDLEAELLALLVLCNSDIFDMADETKVVNA